MYPILRPTPTRNTRRGGHTFHPNYIEITQRNAVTEPHGGILAGEFGRTVLTRGSAPLSAETRMHGRLGPAGELRGIHAERRPVGHLQPNGPPGKFCDSVAQSTLVPTLRAMSSTKLGRLPPKAMSQF